MLATCSAGSSRSATRRNLSRACCQAAAPIASIPTRSRPSSAVKASPSARRTLSTQSPSRAWTTASTLGNALQAALPSSLTGSSSSSSSSAKGAKLPSLQSPLSVLKNELGLVRSNVQQLLGSGHPALDTIAKYYFQAEGKHVRPMMVLLMSQATNGLSPAWDRRRDEAIEREQARAQGSARGGSMAETIDEPLEPSEVLNDQNPNYLASARSFFSDPLASLRTASPTPPPSSTASSIAETHLLPSQRRLAEITEMIHVASLLHDDVIDLAETRRGAPSAPSLFGNKLSVLAGDFLLARASLALSRLGSNEVVELVASVLANLVEGEVMQMKGNVPGSVPKAAASSSSSSSIFSALSPSSSSPSPTGPTPEIFEHYMKKTYLKTASLIAKSTRATTILGGCGVRQGWAEGEKVKDIAYTYGRNVGIAFQVRSATQQAYGHLVILRELTDLLSTLTPARFTLSRNAVD